MRYYNKTKQELIDLLLQLEEENAKLRLSIDEVDTSKISHEADVQSTNFGNNKTELEDLAEKLEKTENNYKFLIENINDIVYEYNSNGILKYISPVVEKTFGFTSADILGKNFIQFVGGTEEYAIKVLNDLRDKGEIHTEYRIPTKTGDIRWANLSTKAVFYGEVFMGGAGTVTDITDRKHFELELKRSELLYRSILDASPDPITITDLEGKILFTSNSVEKIFGFETSVDFANHSILEYIDASDHERASNAIMRMFQNEFSGAEEYKGVKVDGSTFDIEVNGEFIRDENGQPANIIFVTRDITLRKQAEERLKRAEESYRNLVENINEIIYEIDEKGIVKYVSPSIQQMGYEPEEMIGKSFLDFAGEKAGLLYQNLLNIKKGEQVTNEYEMYSKDGQIHWLRFSTKAIYDSEGNFVGGTGTLVDVTERKLAEESLRMSELRYKSFFEGNTSIMILVDPETGEIKDANPAASSYYGWSKEEICRMNISEINILTQDEIAAEMQQAKKEERKHFFFKHRIASNEIHDVEVYSGPIIFGGNTLLYSIVHDITERVLIENALRDSEEKYRSIFETVQDAYYEASIDGILLDISPAIEIISKGQFKREELIGKSLVHFYADPDARTTFYNQMQKTAHVNDYELAFQNKDGSIMPVSISATLVCDSDGNPVKITGSMRDILERKQAEEEIKASEEKYRLLFSNNPQPMWIYDLETLAILEVNGSSIEQYGYTHEEFLQMTIKDVRPVEDIQDLLDDVKKVNKNKNVKGVWRHIWKNGEFRYVEISAQSVDFNGRKARHVLINDITDRIVIENEIKAKSTLLTNLIINMKEGILLEDADRKIVLTNQLFCDMFSIPAPPELMIGADCTNSAEQSKMLFKDPEKFIADITKILKDKKYILNDELQLADGRYFERDYIPTYLNNQYSGHLWKYRDITERKNAENQLRKLSRAVEQSPVSIVITNLNGEIEYANPKAIETTGYSIEELIGQNSRVLQSGETLKGEYTVLWDTIVAGKEWHGLFHNKKKTGELYWESSTISPILDENGQILNFVAIKEDISDKKQADEDLIKFRTVSDMASYGTAIADLNGNLLYLNEAFAQMHGENSKDLIGKNLKIFHNDDQFGRVTSLIADLFEKGEFTAEEVWHVRKDGSVFPTLMNGTLIRNNKNEPLFISASAIDITDIKKAQDDLKNSEESLSFAQKIAKMGNWEVDYRTGKTTWSKNLYQLYEIETLIEEIPMEYFHDMVHPDDLPLFEATIKEITEFRTNLSFDLRLILPNGKMKWIQNNVVPVVENEILVGLKGVNKDVTDKKEKDIQLKIKNERLNAIVQAMPDLIFLINNQGKYLEYYASDTAQGSLVTDHEIVGSNLNDLFDETTAAFHLKNINECIDNQRLVTYDYMLPHGDEISYYEARVVPLSDNKVLTFVRDITAGKHAEAEIKKLSQAVEQSPILVVITDLDGLVEYVNPVFTTVTGYGSDEVIGKSTKLLKSGKTDKAVYTDLWKTISSGKEWHSEWINKKKNGDFYWESVSINPIHDESGKIINYLAVKQDISERKKAEQEIQELNENLEHKIQQRTEQLAETNSDLLRAIEERKRLDEALIASEQSYQTVVENVNEVIFQTDTEGLWLFLNRAWEEVTGFTAEDSLGELFLNYVHPDDRQRNMDLFAPLINKEKGYCRHEVRYLTKDGGFRWVEVFARLGVNDKGEITGTYGTLKDITERKRAEDFENEMLQLSPQLTGISAGEINTALNLALSRIGKFLNADRAYIFEFNVGKDSMSNTYEWCNAGIDAEFDNLQNIPCEILPMWMDELINHRNIIIPSIKNLPESWRAERGILEPQGIQSLIVIPMLIEGQLIGFVGLDSVVVKRDYSIAEINILKVWSSMLASLINNSRTEGLLEQTRQNYETFFNTIDDFLWVLDESGKIIHINNTVSNRLGYSVDELESKSILNVHPKERREEAERIVGEMLQGLTEFCPVPVVTKSGQQIPVETRVKHGNWNGQPAVFGVSKDISKIQLSEQKFSTAFQSNSALMAISIFNGGQYLDVNNSFLEVLDYSREEVIGKTNAELDFFSDKNLREEIVGSIEEHGPVRELEAIIRRKDGELKTILLSADTIFLGETKCLLTVFVDISERKLAEEEIRKARLEAEQANVAKSEFLSRMSHELRTPMNSILGFAQILEMGELNPGQKKGVNHILRSGKHLLSLINEVLDISRIEAGRLSISIEPIKVNSILEEMIDVLRPMANDNEVSMQLASVVDNQLFVSFDRQSFKQVLLNLLNNAIKYNKQGGSVFISAQQLPTSNDNKIFVRISISDTGIGISSDDIPKLFTPFERIGANKTRIEGTGLGLSVVKKLIDAMGGYIAVESLIGEGSTFAIDLPKAENQLNSLKKFDLLTLNDPNFAERRGTVLYIEDNASNIELIEQILSIQRPGIQFLSNPNGGSSVKMATEYKPDLILLDLNLPDMHGSEVLRLLLKNEQTKNIPVVIISADAMHKQVESLLNAGAKRYLTKPVEVVDFLNILDEYIQG